MPAAPCRNCRRGIPKPVITLRERRYERCPRCQCTLVVESDLPSRRVEEEQYRLHENDIDDPGYRKFVSTVVDPLMSVVPAGAHGLDYGCGPGPVGAAMLREKGYTVAEYDPLFAPDEIVLGREYDFILCSEVAEHFHRPADEFDRLDRLLKPGGWLAVMTRFLTEIEQFATWHYNRDPAHVTFYAPETFACIADDRGWDLIIPRRNVALFRRLR